MHLHGSITQRHFVAVQAGFRTQHVLTVACRNATLWAIVSLAALWLGSTISRILTFDYRFFDLSPEPVRESRFFVKLKQMDKACDDAVAKDETDIVDVDSDAELKSDGECRWILSWVQISAPFRSFLVLKGGSETIPKHCRHTGCLLLFFVFNNVQLWLNCSVMFCNHLTNCIFVILVIPP